MEVTMGVLTNLRDDALQRAVDGITELIEASEIIKQKEDYIMRFSENMIYVKELLVKLKPQQSMVADSDSSSDSILRSLLERVETEFNKAREVVNHYKASRCPRIFLHRSVLIKLDQSSKEIYHILRLLNFAQLNYALNINAKAKAIYGKSKELKRAAKDGELAEQVERKYELVSEPVDERLHNHIFTETSNSGSSSPSPRTSFDEIGIPPYYFFFCTLTRKLMEDPVYVPCGHIFEREAIEDYFSQGKKLCHLCKEALSSTEILELTPNIWLRNFILEWKEKNAQIMAEFNARKKLTDLARRITKEDMKSTNHALQEMQALMIETPCCIKEAMGSSSNLIGKLTDLLKYKEANTIAVLGCLLLIARFSDGNKEKIGRSGVIQWLLNESKTLRYALELLLELSENDKVAKKIGGTKTSIATLVTLLNKVDVAETARNVLHNLSSNLKFTTMMVNAGYCIPFLEQFNAQGNSEEDRVSMLKELAEIPLNETAANNLENGSFIGTLAKMLSCNSHSSKSASLECIKKMLSFEGLRTRFLMNERTTIPALLSLIKDDAAEQQCTHDALCTHDVLELLLSVAQTSQNLELDNEPAVLHELYSRDNIQELLEKIKTFANPKNKILLLQLLLELFQKSDAAGERILFESNATSPLFSALVAEENSKVRMYALKVLYRIARQHPTDIPLPTCPTKESIVSSIVAILTDGNCIIEEISAAACIIGHLPTGNQSIDEILQTSNVLKALQDLMSYENKSNELQENALGALLRCTKHSKLQFLVQVSKLLPSLVQLLSTGSPLAKKCTALILDNLARYNDQSQISTSSSFQFLSLHPKAWMKRGATCSVHGSGCVQRLVCLVTAKAVQPLVDMVGIMDSGASEAAFSALDTLFDTNCDSNAASAAIIDSRGAWQILDVLERGALPVRFRALDLLGKIYNHPSFSSDKLKRFEGVLFSLQNSNEEELKSKARVLLVELVSKTTR